MFRCIAFKDGVKNLHGEKFWQDFLKRFLRGWFKDKRSVRALATVGYRNRHVGVSPSKRFNIRDDFAERFFGEWKNLAYHHFLLERRKEVCIHEHDLVTFF